MGKLAAWAIVSTFANAGRALLFLPMLRGDKSETPQSNPEVESEGIEEADRSALLALFRLLVREPPRDHDFNTCPICKRYGITKI